MVGAVGVLEIAADAGLLSDLAAAHDRIPGLRFRIADAILTAPLIRHLAGKPEETR